MKTVKLCIVGIVGIALGFCLLPSFMLTVGALWLLIAGVVAIPCAGREMLREGDEKIPSPAKIANDVLEPAAVWCDRLTARVAQSVRTWVNGPKENKDV